MSELDPTRAEAQVVKPTRTGALNLPHPLMQALLTLRTLVLTVAEPVDYVSRLLNGKQRLPPLSLRRYAGPLPTLETSAGEFVAYLKLLCHANSTSRILDIGCGFGLMALALEDVLGQTGHYVGLDINARATRWASRHISSRLPNFQFIHLNIRNGMYNPRGTLSAETVGFPLQRHSFDIVLLKSVFTHLKPAETSNYMRAVAQLLAPDGICMATFFLLNADQQERSRRGKAAIDFAFGDDEWRYAARNMPELAAAYDEDALSRIATVTGLSVADTKFGTWSGNRDGLSYQDIVCFTRSDNSVGATP